MLGSCSIVIFPWEKNLGWMQAALCFVAPNLASLTVHCETYTGMVCGPVCGQHTENINLLKRASETLVITLALTVHRAVSSVCQDGSHHWLQLWTLVKPWIQQYSGAKLSFHKQLKSVHIAPHESVFWNCSKRILHSSRKLCCASRNVLWYNRPRCGRRGEPLDGMLHHRFSVIWAWVFSQ